MDTGRDPFLLDATEPDLRLLPDIARDRSPAGRARLFALLAALLTARWFSLTPTLRDQLAELVALLLPRALPQDRAQLIAALADRPDVPSVLRHLLPKIETPSHLEPAPPPSPVPPAQPAIHSARGKPVRISITPQAVMTRAIPAAQAPDGPMAVVGPVAEAPEPAPLAMPAAPLPGPGLAAALASANREARLSRNQEDDSPPLAAPRDNPHLLTGEILAETLKAGDLARFEMMLAQLTNLRAPLLRRLLKDGGNESFAILARAIGLDAEEFQRHWQQWRQESFNLAPYSRPPDRREGQRITAFFTALTDRQVVRLMERWRNDGNRLFAAEQPT
jgi:hypothetical protein